MTKPELLSSDVGTANHETWCQNCGVEIPPGHVFCTSCSTPMSNVPLEAEILPDSHSRFLDRPWVLIVLILHLGLLGIPVYWKTGHSLTVRWLMVIGSILYTVLAVVVIAWGIRQLLRLGT